MEETDRRSRLREPGGPTYRAPNGGTVTVSGDVDQSSQWFASFQWERGKSRFGFQTGPVGTVDNLSYPVRDKVELLERYSARGGQVELTWAPDALGPIVAWRGAWHELYAFLPGAGIDVADAAFALLEEFDIEDAPVGLTTRPRDKAMRLFGVSVYKDVAALGGLEILPLPEASGLVPAHSGTVVAGGDLYLRRATHQSAPGVDSEHSHAGGEFYLLCGETAVTVIQPDDDRPLTDAMRLSSLEHLVVEWRGDQ